LAGLAGLGAAAMLKLTGTENAEAINGDALTLGNMGIGNPVPPGPSQTATAETRITVSAPPSNSFTPTGLQVIRAGGSAFLNSTAIVGSTGDSGVGVIGKASGAGGSGVYGQGDGANGCGVDALTSQPTGVAVRARACGIATG